MMSPVFEEVSNELSDVKFVKVDTDVHMDLLSRFNIRGIPFFALFRAGKIIASRSGAMVKSDLVQLIKKHISQ